MNTSTNTLAPETHTTTFADAWWLWLSYRRHGTRPLRASTVADYESIYRKHLGPALAHIPLDHIDGTTIARFVLAESAGNLSLKRLSNILVPLRACLRWHHRLGAIERDPSAWFEPAAPAADERIILTPLQVETLIAEHPVHYRPFVEFAAYVGLRAGEQRALTWSDIDLDGATVSVNKTYYRDTLQPSTKTGHDRTVPMPPHIVTMMRSWQCECPQSSQGLVFPSSTGGVMDLDVYRSRVFRPAVKRAGLPETLRIHDLRHTAASLYLQSGATVREVMEIFGWRQMQTALRYLHTTQPLTLAAARMSEMRAQQLRPHGISQNPDEPN